MQKPLWFVSRALGSRQLASVCTNLGGFCFWRKQEKDLTPPGQAAKGGAGGVVSPAAPFWWAGTVVPVPLVAVPLATRVSLVLAGQSRPPAPSWLPRGYQFATRGAACADGQGWLPVLPEAEPLVGEEPSGAEPGSPVGTEPPGEAAFSPSPGRDGNEGVRLLHQNLAEGRSPGHPPAGLAGRSTALLLQPRLHGRRCPCTPALPCLRGKPVRNAGTFPRAAGVTMAGSTFRRCHGGNAVRWLCCGGRSPGSCHAMAAVPSELDGHVWKWALVPAAFVHRGEVCASPQDKNCGP